VLIVLLDAARRDHFGCYGYARDTTPFIDQLAADGVRFDRVFTDVPFTRGAVPGLLTGHSWVHHRVVTAKGALANDLPTLAESLGQAGYLTLGVSHNPNVSLAAGTDRGFDEFTEVWKLPGPRKRGMEAPARYLIERLEAGLPDQPVFCYLHVIPPHAPYVPRPQDDLWSDPDYAGILENALSDLGLLDRGLLPHDEADRQHVIDLYDGNLRRGDALVESVVTAWQRLRKGHELLTVVVADHGEAFGEHGRFEHSTTLYDEMTAIPLVFHPASLCQTLTASTHQLRSITDVMPLLLHTLGIGVPQAAYLPRAFVELLKDPSWERPYVVQRTNTLFGVRTANHMAFFDRFGGRGLYDLESDPDATRNLVDEMPAGYERCMVWMRQTEAELPAGAAETPDIPEADREALKALGYVDH
jgi:arylsulfatase